MKAVVIFSLSIIILGAKAWSPVKNPFEILPMPYKVHTISDCMHIASEPGDYIFKKMPHLVSSKDANFIEIGEPMAVCGLYVIGEPNTIIEITMKHYDVNCESGGLMAFVDGWELNGEYFPGVKDHHRKLEDRVVEFCNDYSHWPPVINKKFFRSNQNAALLQYRIPIRGSFIANIRYHKITQPCNVLVQDTASVYHLGNFGGRGNCTLSAIFPAVVSINNLKIGGKIARGEKVNYECTNEDRIDIGGSAGMESNEMDIASKVCGLSELQGPEQAIFCGVTSVRLLSSGKYQNQATVVLRKAEETDFEIATLICPL